MRAPRAEEEAGFDCVIELVVACRQVSSGRAPAESAVRRRSRGDEKTPYRRMHLARAAQGVDVRVARGPRKAQESTWISRDGAAHGASLRTALRVNGADVPSAFSCGGALFTRFRAAAAPPVWRCATVTAE